MKKLGKKLSFLTKVMLVIGLLISNLSSLSVVFAYEATGDVGINLVDGNLEIEYLEELAEEVEAVKVNVYENYTYLDDTFEEEVVSNYSLTAEEIAVLGGLKLEHVSILVDDTPDVVENIEVFDGLYEVKVEITDLEGTVIDSSIYSQNVTHKSGLEIKVYDGTNTEIVPLENGTYPVSLENSEVNVVARILSGGLKPTDTFMYEEAEYKAIDLLEKQFASNMNFGGKLFGEYVLPVEVKLLNSLSEEVVYSDSLNIMYESYELNAATLNLATVDAELGESYLFYGEDKDGIVYALLNEEKVNTVLDLYKVVNLAIGEDETITYVISNSQNEDILSTYDVETSEVALEDYLATIMLDDTTVLSIINEGLTITYKVVVAGDLDNNNTLTENDLLELINQVVGKSEVTMEKSDLYGFDEEVNTLDVMYLNQIVKNKEWFSELSETEATIDSRLDLIGEDIVSGDEFTVNYVLSLTDYAVSGVSGNIKYDKTMLELVSVEAYNEWIGNNKDGKFLYLGEESLAGVISDNEGESTETPEGETTGELPLEVTPNEYVVLTATFKALKSGTSSISIENPEYFDQANYLVVEDTVISTDVVVNASDNNNLSSLTVAGQTITLEENVLDYEITVSNDVTAASIEAMVENVAANITSMVFPEELAEGINTVTITVTSESGNEKVYTITVIREEAEEEPVVTQTSYNNYYEEEEETPTVVTPEPEKEENEVVEEEKEESNLSRIIIIILILLVIAGLIYLIFKDEDDEETKKANKEINKLKKEDKVTSKKVDTKASDKKSSGVKGKDNKTKRKER